MLKKDYDIENAGVKMIKKDYDIENYDVKMIKKTTILKIIM